MRWPTPLAIIVAPPPAATLLYGWSGEAYIHSVVISALTLSHHDDAEFSERMRPVLLHEARKLVDVLTGDVPALNGFSARKQ